MHPRLYQSHVFAQGESNTCVTLSLEGPDVSALYTAAYLDRFDPAGPCVNYLADWRILAQAARSHAPSGSGKADAWW